jgi:uncharacterized membrane protein YczE
MFFLFKWVFLWYYAPMQKNEIKPLIKKAGELCWVLGLFLISLGTAICSKANLGISMIAAPAFIIHEAIIFHVGKEVISVGILEYLVQTFVLLLMCAIVRGFNWRYVLSFITAICYGLALNMWVAILGDAVFDALWLRWIMFFVGNTCVCIGVAFFFRSYLPVESYELIVHEISRVYKLKMDRVKWVYDGCSLIVSLILALSLFGDVATFDWSKIYMESFHSIGLGTALAAVISAPIIHVIDKLFDRIFGRDPVVKSLHKVLYIHDKEEVVVTDGHQMLDDIAHHIDDNDVVVLHNPDGDDDLDDEIAE